MIATASIMIAFADRSWILSFFESVESGDAFLCSVSGRRAESGIIAVHQLIKHKNLKSFLPWFFVDLLKGC